MKLDAVTAATAHHILDGAVVFPDAVDAHSAVARHPDEWSMTPWTAERADKARARAKARYDRDVAEAKARGLPEPIAPAHLNPPAPLAPEDQKAIDEHTQAQIEAADRVAAYDAEQAERKKVEEQVAADRALLEQPAPQPDPARRPFGRKGEPTEKEREMMARREAKAAAGPQLQGSVKTDEFVD